MNEECVADTAVGRAELPVARSRVVCEACSTVCAAPLCDCECVLSGSGSGSGGNCRPGVLRDATTPKRDVTCSPIV